MDTGSVHTEGGRACTFYLYILLFNPMHGSQKMAVAASCIGKVSQHSPTVLRKLLERVEEHVEPKP